MEEMNRKKSFAIRSDDHKCASITFPPLTGLRVLEFAGLAPGPFAGLLLADFGATVLRIDRPHASGSTGDPSYSPAATPDVLAQRKSSISVNLKSQSGIALIKNLLCYLDIIIDPFRPGVLEALGIAPQRVLRKINPRLIVARLTGFRRDGKYTNMAGHDINYIAVSGILSMLGRAGEKPYPPGNLLGDFAGGGAVAFMGILLALFNREKTGEGQVVEANMVDGSAYMATMPRILRKTPVWNSPRGTNLLDGGCPYYDTYETKDGRYMAVGALEPQFFQTLLRGLSINPEMLPGPREDKQTWPFLSKIFTAKFRSKTRAEWEHVFDNSDACCTPVMSPDELEAMEYAYRPIVHLQRSPALGSDDKNNPAASQFPPGSEGEEVIRYWTGGWKRGVDYDVADGSLVKTKDGSTKFQSKL